MGGKESPSPADVKTVLASSECAATRTLLHRGTPRRDALCSRIPVPGHVNTDTD
jgi:hypothetical protein